MCRLREGRLRFYQHDPSGPHTVRGVIDHATVTSTQVIRSSVTVTGTVGQVFQLTSTASDALGHTVSGVSVTWSVLDSTVASVDSTGLVTMLRTGTTTVTATVDGRAYPTVVSVSAVQQGVDFSKVNLITVGDSYATGTGANNPPVGGYSFRMGTVIQGLGGTFHNHGYSGQTAYFAATVFATDVVPNLDVTKINILSFQFGSNDLSNAAGGGIVGDAYLGGLLQLIGLAQAQRALGFSIVIMLWTPPDGNSATQSSANYRLALPMAQAYLRENYKAMGADILADVAAIYRIGSVGAADNTTAPLGLFAVDKIHPNDGGHLIYAKRGLGAIYEYYGLTQPTGLAANGLVGCFEMGVAAKGLGTYRPALWPRQGFTTDLIQTPPSQWANWNESRKSLYLGQTDLPWTSATGFSITQWVDLTAADVADGAHDHRGLNADVGNAAMLISNIPAGSGGKFRYGVYHANSTSNLESKMTPSTIAAGVHTLGMTYDPTQPYGSRITLYVDRVKQNGSTDFNFGADGAIARPSGQWNEDLMIGDNQFAGAAPLDYHQAVDVLTATGVRSDAEMAAQSDYLLSRWPSSLA